MCVYYLTFAGNVTLFLLFSIFSPFSFETCRFQTPSNIFPKFHNIDCHLGVIFTIGQVRQNVKYQIKY